MLATFPIIIICLPLCCLQYVEIKIYKIMIVCIDTRSVVLYRCKAVTLREECILEVFSEQDEDNF
jgi:hypothetical protein